MNYTMHQRQDLAKMFRAAKELLWDGVGEKGRKCMYICVAIDAVEYGVFHEDIPGAAKNIIFRRLRGAQVMERWLLDNVHHLSLDYLFSPEGRVVAQDYRHVWIDAL